MFRKKTPTIAVETLKEKEHEFDSKFNEFFEFVRAKKAVSRNFLEVSTKKFYHYFYNKKLINSNYKQSNFKHSGVFEENFDELGRHRERHIQFCFDTFVYDKNRPDTNIIAFFENGNVGFLRYSDNSLYSSSKVWEYIEGEEKSSLKTAILNSYEEIKSNHKRKKSAQNHFQEKSFEE